MISLLNVFKNLLVMLILLLTAQMLVASDDWFTPHVDAQLIHSSPQQYPEITDPNQLFSMGNNYQPTNEEYSAFMETYFKDPVHQQEHDEVFKIPKPGDQVRPLSGSVITHTIHDNTVTSFVDMEAEEKVKNCIETLINDHYEELCEKYQCDYIDFVNNRMFYFKSIPQVIYDTYLLEKNLDDKKLLWNHVKKLIDEADIVLKINCDVFPVFENPWYKKAVTRVLASNNKATVLAYYRALQHNGGYIAHDIEQPASSKIFLKLTCQTTYEKQYLLTPLANFLKLNGMSASHHLSGNKVTIKQQNSLTVEQTNIIEKLSTAQVDNSTHQVNHNDVTYLHYNQGRKLIGEELILENIIINGPLFVKAKKITLKGDIDVLDGMVLTAEQFDISKSRIWQFSNNHFIKVNKINLENHTSIINS